MNYFVRSRYYQLNPYGLTIRQRLLIRYLARQLGWDDSHLSNFINKYYHKRQIEKLSRKEAIKLIEYLKNVREHSK